MLVHKIEEFFVMMIFRHNRLDLIIAISLTFCRLHIKSVRMVAQIYILTKNWADFNTINYQ